MSGIADNFAASSLLQTDAAQKQAGILKSATYKGFTVRPMTITAAEMTAGAGAPYGNPIKVPFPFKGVFVRAASDSITFVNLGLHDDSNINIDNSVQLFVNDSFKLQNLVAAGVLTFPPQAGKSITLYFIVDGDFVSGSQLSITSGGVSVTEGSAVSVSQVTLTASAASQLFGQNSSRKLGTWNNDTGAVAYLGTAVVSNTGQNKGLAVQPGATLQWRNSSAAYVYSSGGSTTIMEES